MVLPATDGQSQQELYIWFHKQTTNRMFCLASAHVLYYLQVAREDAIIDIKRWPQEALTI